MATLDSVQTVPMRRRVLRWLRNIGVALFCLVALLAITGASYQALETYRDSRRFPKAGRLVDIGGYGLNINCAGQGSPTVVFESGFGGPAMEWRLVQPQVAQFTRVCSYDRAGYGWSDAGPNPRTSAQIAEELHTLLHNAGEEPPYVLVGHSFGGYNVRVFNGLYPNDVAGMVLVDAAHEDQIEKMPANMKKSNEDAAKSAELQLKLAPLLLRLGITRLMIRNLYAETRVSRDILDELHYLNLQPKFVQATSAESAAISESANQVRESGNLGDKPLIVLTAGKLRINEAQLPKGVTKKDYEDLFDIWVNDLQLREAHLSTRGKRIMVPDSGHIIPFERPDSIVNAVREVCSEVNVH
jgi:pimeloyl-ACP methyl ester carboxylesterase